MENTLTTLHIALEDGFDGHDVTIEIGGRKVYGRQGVKTDLRISRADAVNVALESAQAHLSVSVEPGRLQASFDVDALATPYLSISIVPPGTILFTPSADMPRYM